MKIICVIDYLCQGGAQRQLTTLAAFFKELGHEVSFLTYHESDFFRPALDRAGIPLLNVRRRSKVSRALALRRVLRSSGEDAVLAFLEGPALYSELAAMPGRKWGLVVSERLQLEPRKLLPDWKRLPHHVADYVTTNSHANREVLGRNVPGLRRKIVTIFNCIDLSYFRPAEAGPPRSPGPIEFVVAASYQERKNTIGLIRALAIVLRDRPGLQIRIDWYGGIPFFLNGRPDTRYFEEARALTRELGLTEHIGLHLADRDILGKYQAADAVLLPSKNEGLPNTLCEGMACGRPILSSRIGDAGLLVVPGRNGFLFDPSSPDDMARAIGEFCGLSAEKRAEWGRESRRMAERLFSPLDAAKAYLRLLEAAAARTKIPIEHWPPNIGA